VMEVEVWGLRRGAKIGVDCNTSNRLSTLVRS